MEKKTNQELLGLVTEISHPDSLKLTFKSKIEKIKTSSKTVMQNIATLAVLFKSIPAEIF